MYFGATVSKSFFVSAELWIRETINLRAATESTFALVTIFSMKGRSSLALAVVVLILESRMRFRAKNASGHVSDSFLCRIFLRLNGASYYFYIFLLPYSFFPIV
jgi:hypothetical protein